MMTKNRLIASIIASVLLGSLSTALLIDQFKPGMGRSSKELTFKPFNAEEWNAQSRVEILYTLNDKDREALKKYAGYKESDLEDNAVLCEGIVVAEDAVATTSSCILSTELVGRPYNYVVRYKGKIFSTIDKILGIDQVNDLAFLLIKDLKASPIPQLNSKLSVSDIVIGGMTPNKLGQTSKGEGIAIGRSLEASGNSEVLRLSMPLVMMRAGSPIFDHQGRICGMAKGGALNSGGIILATGAKSIKTYTEQYVTNRNPKAIVLSSKDSRDFRASNFLHRLGFPFVEKSLAPLKKEISNLSVKITFPLTPDDLDQNLINGLNDQTKNIFTKLMSAPSPFGRPTVSWEKMVNAARPNLIGGIIEPQKLRLYSYDGGKSIVSPAVFLTPPEDDTSDPTLLATYPFTSPIEERPRKPGDVADQPEDISTPQDITTASEPPESPRSLGLMVYKPLLTVRLKPIATRSMSTKQILDILTGNAGITVAADTKTVKSQAQKEFIIKRLEGPVETADVVDQLGRKWQLFGLDILGTHGIDTWCSYLPQGTMCLSLAINLYNHSLRKVFRANVAQYVLHRYLLEPTFWSVASLMDYQDRGLLAQEPLMRDFRVFPKESGVMNISFDSIGIKVGHKVSTDQLQLRLIGGLKFGFRTDWRAMAHQIYIPNRAKADSSEEGRLCDVGLVQNGQQVPKGSLVQSVSSAKTGETHQVYSYCVQVSKTSETSNALEITSKILGSVDPYPVNIRAI